jgi:hypothetical protein
MATIVNNPDSGANAAGWVIAAIVLVAVVLIGLFVWPGLARTTGSPAPAQVNVQIPTPNTGGGGTGGGGASY